MIEGIALKGGEVVRNGRVRKDVPISVRLGDLTGKWPVVV